MPTLLEGELPEVDPAPVTMRAPSADDEEREDTITDKIAVDPTSPVRDRAMLTVLSGTGAGRCFLLDKEKTVIGRGRGVDIHLNDNGISRAHARIIRWVGLAYVVEDLGSMNGTFVNGRRIERATISSGDRLQLGPTAQLRFSLADDTESQLQTKLYDGLARDPFTDVYTRDHLLRQLRLEVAHARRHDSDVSLVLVAIAGYRAVVRKSGANAATLHFQRLARKVAECGRIEDLVARYDDGTVAVLLRTTDPERALAHARRVLAIAPEVFPGDAEPALGVRIAVASVSEVGVSAGPDELVGLGAQRLEHCRSHPDVAICGHD